MMVEIEKIIKENKNYLYQRIKNFLDKVQKLISLQFKNK